MKKIKVKYNFKKYKSGELSRYYDKENVVSLTIFKSGWEGLYNCVLEWGEYEQSEIKTLPAYQIQNYYGIKTFNRKEKLLKINEKGTL